MYLVFNKKVLLCTFKLILTRSLIYCLLNPLFEKGERHRMPTIVLINDHGSILFSIGLNPELLASQ